MSLLWGFTPIGNDIGLSWGASCLGEGKLKALLPLTLLTTSVDEASPPDGSCGCARQ